MWVRDLEGMRELSRSNIICFRFPAVMETENIVKTTPNLPESKITDAGKQKSPNFWYHTQCLGTENSKVMVLGHREALNTS